MKKCPAVYIVANTYNTTVYIGVTNNLLRRVWEHKNKISEGFTNDYNLEKLVYYEFFDVMAEAITREKQLKKWSRIKKNFLIFSFNPNWNDVYDSLI